jgi:hypothetical protein
LIDVTAGTTVSVALDEVVLEDAPSAVAVTTTRYRSPLSLELVVADVVYEDEVAPEMFDHEEVAFDSAFCHW